MGDPVDMGAAWRERKFVMVVDGRGTPSSRLAPALGHDCLVLKQESSLQEWFYGVSDTVHPILPPCMASRS